MSSHEPDTDLSPATRLTHAVESATSLDALAASLHQGSQRLVADPGRARLLRSGLFGHALHPMLTDVPIGAWMSAALLDWTGGPRMRPASRRLVGVGNLAALPTAVTGLAEFTLLDARSQRVASAHAVANYVALGLNTWSWVARRKEQHGLGRMLTCAALAAGGAGAFLGGHLAIGRKDGSHDPQVFDADAGMPSTAPTASAGAAVIPG